ncbi:MAG TPA: hypothetical protein VH307_08635, partial [Streptosporangiaceae bacterium]|nr:hypothetical protein [Streptosporangiaceae bacterium]
QARQLTGSAVAVGLLGAVELAPLVVFGLYGGALADRLDRRRLIRWCEAGLACCAALLVVNASLRRTGEGSGQEDRESRNAGPGNAGSGKTGTPR